MAGFRTVEGEGVQMIEVEGTGVDMERCLERGNPDLEPLESTNVDLRWEYYPTGVSMVSAGFISDYFLGVSLAGEGPLADFDEVSQVINCGDAELYGLEFAFICQFDVLPGPWGGLLLDANYTFTDSTADMEDRASDVPSPRQSAHIFNVALYNFLLAFDFPDQLRQLDHLGRQIDSVNF